MANENCLEGFKCPQCGNEDRFGIACEVVLEVTDEGTGEQLRNGHEWDNDSYCECRECLKAGKVKDFYTEPGCPHYVDNQGFCHQCGILMNEEWARESGYYQEGMVEGQ